MSRGALLNGGEDLPACLRSAVARRALRSAQPPVPARGRYGEWTRHEEGVAPVTPRGRSDGRAFSSRPRGGRPERPPAGPRGGLAALRERLVSVIAPVTQEAGFDLERVSVSRAGRRHRVQVIVDRDHGVELDAIAEVSRAVSAALDRADETGAAVVPGEYVLEVSSPGVDRPLTEPRHWRRNLGRLVAVTVAGEGQVTGRVLAAGNSGVTLDVEGSVRELPYASLGPGRVQVELRPAGGDEPGEDPAGADLEAEAEAAEAGGVASGEETGGRPERRSGKGGA